MLHQSVSLSWSAMEALPSEEVDDAPEEVDPRISVLVEEFQVALESEADDTSIVQRFLMHGRSYAVDDSQEFEIKRSIAQEFSLNVSTDLFVVGSAKLGFSIAPDQRWKPFGNESDIDIAIISHDLYQTVWHEVYDYSTSGADWPDKRQFQKYLFRGWIRPDLLPSGPTFDFVDRWWAFFQQLKAREIAGPYKIAGALYHDTEFLRKYHAFNVARCRRIGEE